MGVWQFVLPATFICILVWHEKFPLVIQHGSDGWISITGKSSALHLLRFCDPCSCDQSISFHKSLHCIAHRFLPRIRFSTGADPQEFGFCRPVLEGGCSTFGVICFSRQILLGENNWKGLQHLQVLLTGSASCNKMKQSSFLTQLTTGKMNNSHEQRGHFQRPPPFRCLGS